jgi:hypothetical protein
MKIKILLLTIYTLFTTKSYTNEPETNIINPEKKIDTLDFKYQFYKGDTLFYNVIVWDSIKVGYDDVLLKQRLDHIRITCDSVTKKGIMFLSQTMLESESKEAFGKDEKSTRTNSPWIGRKTIIAIDSTGKRITQFYEDSTNLAVNPGGVYFPHLFFDIGATKKKVNESWIVRASDTLVENSFPPSLLNHSSLMRLSGTADTLGYITDEIMYIRTGQGSFYFESEDNFLSNSNVINSSGKLRISEKYHIPVHYFVTIEQKINMYDRNENETPIWHYLQADYVLERFIDSPLRPKSENTDQDGVN